MTNQESEPAKMMMTVVEIDMESYMNKPAITSRGKCYLVKDDKVVGTMRVVSTRSIGTGGLYGDTFLEPSDDAAKEFFKDDFTIPLFGQITRLQYFGVTGEPGIGFDDEPEDRHKGTRVVDCLDFDFGICHESFSHIEGFGKSLTPNNSVVKNFDKYVELKDEDGYVPFNEYRELGQNQYASRYTHGRLEHLGFPNLGDGLRWKNRESGNYHRILIHIDDLSVFHSRYHRFRNGTL